MRSRILKLIHHYCLWQFAGLAIALFLVFPIVSEKIIQLINRGPVKVEHEGFCLLLSLVIIVLYITAFIKVIRRIRYREATGGRSYQSDAARYKRSYTELVETFRDADPYRLNLQDFPEKSWKEIEGIVIGQAAGHVICRQDNNNGINLLTAALPSTGKTSSQIIPTALRFSGSVFLIDIKGDCHSAVVKNTHLYAKKDISRIRVFDPEEPEISYPYDPLAGVESMSDDDRRELVEMIAYTLIPDLDNDNPFFTEGAREFFTGCTLYEIKKGNVSFPGICKKIATTDAYCWIETIKNDDDAGDAYLYIDSYDRTNEKNTSGIYNQVDIIHMIKEHYKRKNIKTEWLLTNDKGSRITRISICNTIGRINNAHKELIARSNHCIRKTVITEMIQSNLFTQKEIQTYFGHKSYATTSKYYDFALNDTSKNAPKMDKALGNKLADIEKIS